VTFSDSEDVFVVTATGGIVDENYRLVFAVIGVHLVPINLSHILALERRNEELLHRLLRKSACEAIETE
jgi:hypothetical protein